MEDQLSVSRFYDRYGEKEWQRLDADPRARVIYHLHRLALERFVRPGDRVADIGCGPGRFTRDLIELSASVTAGDLSTVQLRLHRDHGAASQAGLTLLSATALPFANATFDCTVCFGSVLSHLGNEAALAAAELARITKRGGFILLSVMSARNYYLPYLVDLSREYGVEAVGESLLTGSSLPDATGIPWRAFTLSELELLARHTGCDLISASASNVLATVADIPLLEEMEHNAALWQAFLSWEAGLAAQKENVERGSHIIVVLQRRF